MLHDFLHNKTHYAYPQKMQDKTSHPVARLIKIIVGVDRIKNLPAA